MIELKNNLYEKNLYDCMNIAHVDSSTSSNVCKVSLNRQANP